MRTTPAILLYTPAMMQIGSNRIPIAPATLFTVGLLLMVTFTPTSMHAQQQNTTFESLTINDGLSASFVTTILQDRKGYIWIGTQDGLNRYDGYDFRIFRSVLGDSLSLNSNSITTLSEDSRGRIWVGTRSGINYFDPGLDHFISFRTGQAHTASLPDGSIRAVQEDHEGYIWIGMDNGLFRMAPDLQSIDTFKSDPEDPESIPGESVWALVMGLNSGIWVGTDRGISLLTPENLSFTRFPNQPDNLRIEDTTHPPVMIEARAGVLWIGTPSGLSIFESAGGVLDDRHQMADLITPDRSRISSFHPGIGNEIWVGTNSGLNLIQTDTGTITTFRNISTDPRSLQSNNITALFMDRSGILWVGTNLGISRSNPGSGRIRSFSINPLNESEGLTDNQAWSIFEDSSGQFWFGTDRGIDCFLPGEGYIHRFIHNPLDPTGLSHNIVMAINKTRAGELLVGTRGGGLNRLYQEKGTFIHYRHDPGDQNSISNDFVYRIHKDAGGIIWLATGSGLNRFDPRTDRFTSFHIPPEDLPDGPTGTDIWALIEDHRGYFWVGIWGGGLYRFDRATTQFTHISNTSPESDSELGINILSLLEDSSGIVWIGALDGLHGFDPESGEFTHFSIRDGLPNNVIYGILEDDSGRLWLSTNRGISRFDREEGLFSNFDTHDGLQSLEFNRGAYLKSQSGELYFGGINGVSAFSPDDMIRDLTPPKIIISEFSLFNEPVPIGPFGPNGRTILERSISETDEIRLSYRDRNISFGLTALQFVATDLIKYAYQMEPIDPQLNRVGNRRYATYYNLSPGKYEFQAFAIDRDGNFSDEAASLQIIISPPFTKTWWFRLIVAVVLMATIIGVIQYRTATIRKRNILLEQSVTERTSELRVANLHLGEEVEVRKKTEDQLQKQIEERLRLESQIQQAQKLESMGVLAGGIAHDFNNLLTGVLGNAELALMELQEDDPLRHRIEAIQSSAERAADLSLQMLAYSGKGFFKFEVLDLSIVIGQMISQVSHLLPDQVDMKTELPTDLPKINADSSQIVQATSNLFINAIEAIGEEQGTVTIVTGSDTFGQQYLSETYLDEKLPEGSYAYVDILDTGGGMDPEALLRAFDPFYSTKFTGRGLGLAATLGIVRGHKGAVRVESTVEFGTHFRLLFPVVEDTSTPVQIAEKPDRSDLGVTTILLVDDEATVLETGTALLESLDLEVIQASGGTDAIAVFTRCAGQIDLMIVDMTMPDCNGVKVLEEVRRIDPDIPVLIASGYSEDTLAKELTDELPSGFIQKPFTRATLKEGIEDAMNR